MGEEARALPVGVPAPGADRHEGDRRAAGLKVIRAAGLSGVVRPASAHTTDEAATTERALPVVAELRSLLPGGALRRGATVSVRSPSVLLALLVAASRAGSWCAVVGMPSLSPVAAAEMGIPLERLALIPNPGAEWTTTVAALLDGLDIVVAAPPGPVAASVSSRLAARARQRGSVLIPTGAWTGADLTVEAVRGVWSGLGSGRGRLRCRELTVRAHGRGAAAVPREVTLWLPAPTGPFPPPPAYTGPAVTGPTPIAPFDRRPGIVTGVPTLVPVADAPAARFTVVGSEPAVLRPVSAVPAAAPAALRPVSAVPAALRPVSVPAVAAWEAAPAAGVWEAAPAAGVWETAAVLVPGAVMPGSVAREAVLASAAVDSSAVRRLVSVGAAREVVPVREVRDVPAELDPVLVPAAGVPETTPGGVVSVGAVREVTLGGGVAVREVGSASAC